MDNYLKSLIQNRLDAREQERQRIIEARRYNVQYCPCGHSREIDPEETDLVERAREREKKYVDALILPSENCPICRSNLIDTYVRYLPLEM